MSVELPKVGKGLKVIILNCTLKRTGNVSHTEGILGAIKKIMEKAGAEVSMLRPVDYVIAPGVYPDMTEYGWERDDWPQIFKKVAEADIVILGSPIWLGEKSSVCSKVIERLYAHSTETNNKEQYLFYGKVGGCVITGNEDGVKHCSMSILFALQHIGFTIPPQADSGWIGDIGPGLSYLDEGSGGPDNNFTSKNTTFMSWNLMHLASMLKEKGGIPAYGNVAKEWENGERFGFEKPQTIKKGENSNQSNG